MPSKMWLHSWRGSAGKLLNRIRHHPAIWAGRELIKSSKSKDEGFVRCSELRAAFLGFSAKQYESLILRNRGGVEKDQPESIFCGGVECHVFNNQKLI